MDNRKEKRTFGLKNVTVKDSEKEFQAVLTDISSKGLCIKTEYVLPTYKVIGITVTIKDKTYSLQGSVRWVNEYPGKSKKGFNEIGVKLINPPADFTSDIQTISHLD